MAQVLRPGGRAVLALNSPYAYIVRKGISDELPNAVDTGAIEVAICDEPAPAREGSEVQRAVSHHRQCAQGLRVGAKLFVVRSEELGFVHECHGAAAST